MSVSFAVSVVLSEMSVGSFSFRSLIPRHSRFLPSLLTPSPMPFSVNLALKVCCLIISTLLASHHRWYSALRSALGIEGNDCRAMVLAYFTKEGKPVIDVDGKRGDILQLVIYILHLILRTLDK